MGYYDSPDCGFKHGRNWYSVDPFAWRLLPRSGGVYAIYFDGKLQYIGQSENIQARIHSYRFQSAFIPGVGVRAITPWGNVSRLNVQIRRSIRFGDWLMIEARLLSRVKPPKNSRFFRTPKLVKD